MVDVTITPANVVPGQYANITTGIAGETITAGKIVFINPTTNRYMLADNNAVDVNAKKPVGVALNGSSNGQPIDVQKSGPITIGGTLTPGATYFLGDTPGGLCPDVDVAAGESVALMGVAASASVLNLDIQIPDVTR